MKKGIFITFEGPEGAGKSTQIALLSEWLKKKAFSVLKTREPGGTRIGEKIRGILLDAANKEMVTECEMLLYQAARAQIVREIIGPALSQGKIVICDRFFDATSAYQGYAGKIELNIIDVITDFAIDGLTPDLTILLDIDAEKGLKRSRGDDRLERKSSAYHKQVRRGYLTLAKKYPERIKVIKVIDDIGKVREKIREVVGCRLRGF